jgi:hypothetical protein
MQLVYNVINSAFSLLLPLTLALCSCYKLTFTNTLLMQHIQLLMLQSTVISCTLTGLLAGCV